MAEKNHIINYFACRQWTEKIVKDIEHSVSKTATTGELAINVVNFKLTEVNSKDLVFGLLTKK